MLISHIKKQLIQTFNSWQRCVYTAKSKKAIYINYNWYITKLQPLHQIDNNCIAFNNWIHIFTFWHIGLQYFYIIAVLTFKTHTTICLYTLQPTLSLNSPMLVDNKYTFPNKIAHTISAWHNINTTQQSHISKPISIIMLASQHQCFLFYYFTIHIFFG